MTEQEQIELWAREVRAQEGMETSKDKLLCEMAHVGYIKNRFEVYVHSKKVQFPTSMFGIYLMVKDFTLAYDLTNQNTLITKEKMIT